MRMGTPRSAQGQTVERVSAHRHVAYVTSPTDGWGEREPTDEERESYCALVEQRLGEWYPDHTIEAYTDRDAGGGEIRRRGSKALYASLEPSK